MKPGPGVFELWDARWRRCCGCTHTGGAWAPGPGSACVPQPRGPGLKPSGDQSRAGCVRAVPAPPPRSIPPTPEHPLALSPGLRKRNLGRENQLRGHCGLSSRL
uniref:RIKEN cDNA A930033H14 gene n=1 Tax=Mus spicilegus TaxID=10103 RepID=A0A8C6N591_MUSSI